MEERRGLIKATVPKNFPSFRRFPPLYIVNGSTAAI
jgi:hypothetical protein